LKSIMFLFVFLLMKILIKKTMQKNLNFYQLTLNGQIVRSFRHFKHSFIFLMQLVPEEQITYWTRYNRSLSIIKEKKSISFFTTAGLKYVISEQILFFKL
jgi:hypothetical protein